jgi:aldehyde dehydrogenase (NAD+)
VNRARAPREREAVTTWPEEQLLIDGKLTPAGSGATYETVNPATEAVLGVAADATVDDARRAIGAARRAFDTTDWSRNHARRVRCLRQLHQALRDNLDPLREILVSEVGAPISSTSGPQLEGPVAVVDWYADLLDGYEFVEDLGERDTFAGRHHRWIEKEAAGVVAAIAAYNYPIQLALAKLAPALAAGCTVVLKGAPDTPWATLALGKLVADATDIPPGVVNVLVSSDNAVGAELTTHADVDVVSFTGSTPVGRQIMAAASTTVKRVFLELGGKSAFVLLDDGDASIAALFCSYAAISHSGQGCAITSRLVVPRDRYDEVVDMARTTLAGVAYGDPTDPANMMGPLISARQREKVAGYVDRAIANGAKAVVGGRIPEHLPRGFFYEPTLLVGADENSAVAQDELFGPVLVVLPHDGDDDAVRIANNSIFGLSGAVLSADRERALKVARGIRAGTMSVNGGLYYAPDAPFGGYKQSGIGREMGAAGLNEFLELKTLAEPAS